MAIAVGSYVVEVPAYSKDRWRALCIEKGGEWIQMVLEKRALSS